jgi:hypothetical protein
MSTPETTAKGQSQYWAKVIRDGARDDQTRAVIGAINHLTRLNLANRAAVIMGCAQVLGQNISGEPEIAKEMRDAIMELVDGFAMQSATLEIRQ